MPYQNPQKKIEYQREYQREHKKELLRKKKEKIKRRKEFINKAKSEPCADCGVEYSSWVMDFDHVRGEKKYNLQRLSNSSASWKTIKDEIAKCDVVCSNCHRQRTHDRSTGSRSG